MSLDRRTAAALALVLAYCALVVAPLRARLERGAQGGTEAQQALGGRLETLRARHDEREQELTRKLAQLRAKSGLARVAASPDVTLDSLLEAVHRCSAEAGGTLRSATPMASVQSKTLELQGLQCTIDFGGEESLAEFLILLHKADRAPYAMLQQMTLSRQEGVLRLDAGIGLLRALPDAPPPPFPLEEWAGVQRTATWSGPAWLLEPKPAAQPAGPVSVRFEPPRPVPAPAAAPPPAPPPPPRFEGQLLGAGTSSDGRDFAVFELSGKEHVVGRGEKLGGWLLVQVLPDQAVLELEGRRVTVFFTREERGKPAASAPPRPRPAPLEPAKPAALPARATAQDRRPATRLLGLRAVPTMVAAGSPLPAPYDKTQLVYSVVFVSRRSIAERCGLRPGDRLLAIDGTPLQMDEQILGLRTSLAQGRESTLAVERGGMLLQVAMTP